MTTLIPPGGTAAEPARFPSGASVSEEVRFSNGDLVDSLSPNYAILRHTASSFNRPSPAEDSSSLRSHRLYTVRLVKATGEEPLLEKSEQVAENGTAFVTLVLPSYVQEKPFAGRVSLRELQHPVTQKAIRAAYDAHRFSLSGDTHKAIVKLQDAIRIAPAYRDAHVNLGVEYAQADRIQDAIKEFSKALVIGPPLGVIYKNLAMALLSIQDFRQAGAAASHALSLDPNDLAADKLLAYANAHR